MVHVHGEGISQEELDPGIRVFDRTDGFADVGWDDGYNGVEMHRIEQGRLTSWTRRKLDLVPER